jgi:hypothetical protein
MTIRFDLPQSIEDSLKSGGLDPSRVVLEAALVELYRQDRIYRVDLGDALGLTRLEVDALLKRHNVTEDLQSLEEYEHDMERFRQAFDR